MDNSWPPKENKVLRGSCAAGGKLVNLDDDFTKVEAEDGAGETDGMPTPHSQAYQFHELQAGYIGEWEGS